VDRELKQQFELINKKLNTLAAGQRKETWVRVTWVTDLTGWNYKKMELARKHKLIEYKKDDEGYLYLLESIPEQFIKKVS
jgi:hypothetical protein